MSGTGAPRVVRDWALPADWTAQQDVSVFGDAGPPVFADPWGVLEEPGGPVTVAVCPAELPGSSPDRHPPTLLLERRRLTTSRGVAQRRTAGTAPEDSGPSAWEGHLAVESAYGPVTMLLGRPWGVHSGPDVRVVAVVAPANSSDAVVLTFTWDDEHGMDTLVALATRTVQQMTLRVEDTAIGAGPHSAAGPAHGAVFPPPDWIGTRSLGTVGRAAHGLTRFVRKVFGATGFGRAVVVVWGLLVAFVAAALILAGSVAGQVVVDAVLGLSCVVPVLLTWRSWTMLHGLVTDPRNIDPRYLPPRLVRPVGLWTYLATALLLGVVAFGSFTPGGFVRNGGLLAVWLTAHVLLVIAEYARGWAPRIRRRLGVG